MGDLESLAILVLVIICLFLGILSFLVSSRPPVIIERKVEAKKPRKKRRGKLTKDQVDEIIYALSMGHKAIDLAHKYGVSRTTISRVRYGEYKGVADDI